VSPSTRPPIDAADASTGPPPAAAPDAPAAETPRPDAADRAALDALARQAAAVSGAATAWWQLPHEQDAEAPDWAAATRVPALADGRCLATLWLVEPRRPFDPQRPDLAALVTVAAALLRARAQAQAAQREAERLRDAVGVASDWLWETDADSRTVWMTDAVSRLTQVPVAGEIGLRPLDLNRRRNDAQAASWDAYQAARAARQPFRDLILDRDTPDGTITVSISGKPRFDADGRFLGYRGATRDITRELRARDEAQRARTLLEQTLEGLPAGVMISGPDDRILLTNARWRATLGKDLPPEVDTWEALVRHHARAGHYPDAVGRVEDYVRWRLAQASERPAQVELQWRDEWVMSIDRRLPDGCVVHLSVYISERRRAEQALARSEDRWRFALDGAGHAVWDWDAETDSAYFSPAWCRMLGYEEGEIEPSWREWSRRIHPDDYRRVKREVLRHQAGETAIYEARYRMRHKDGRDLWIQDRGKVVRRADDGRPLRVVGTQSDVTQQRAAEQALRDKYAAEAVSRSKSEFLSRMSHEMRTPLNAMIGFAELMQLRGEYRAEQVEQVLAASHHLLALVNDVLDLQQVEQGTLVARSDALALAPLVDGVRALLQPQAERQQVTLVGETLGDAHVRADAQRLRQVLLNLGSNAIKYNRPQGCVRWRLRDDAPAQWGLAIEDDGPGLDETQLARLFQPFERLGRETSGTEGSGLGLLIARRLAEAMQGRLEIRSRPGTGTSVTVWLPRATPRSAAPAPSIRPDRPPPPSPDPPRPRTAGGHDGTHDGDANPERPRRVLYVEDNALNALLFSEALRGAAGIELRVAEDGTAALDAVQGWTPDLLVIDGHLPGAQGHEVLRALRARPGLAATPAVMCSADALPEERERALAHGFVDYWTKPVEVRRLAADIAAVIERRSACACEAEGD
jgi:PAS domain S-box-containing protein